MFSDGGLNFQRAEFSGSRVIFHRTVFSGSRVTFRDAVFSDGDREMTYRAPWVPFVSLRFADFTSARVGDYQYNPIWGIVLDKLWVR